MDIVQEEKFVFTPLYAITQQSTDGADPLQAERERQMRRAERFGVEFHEPPKESFIQVKRYANPFLIEEQKQKKLEERGLRFGLIDPEEKAKKERRQQKFGSLVPLPEVDEKEEEEKGKGLELEEEEDEESMDVETREPKKEWPVGVQRRADTLYLYGTDKMSTEDVFKYFVDFKPRFVEWIDDSSCNVVFPDHSSAAQAFVDVTDPAGDEEALAVPAGEAEVLYVWRQGKKLWRNHTLLLRFATTEDRRPIVPKKSAWVEDMLRKRSQQRRGPAVKGNIGKERQQTHTQNKKSKRERRRGRKGGDEGETSMLKKAIISSVGLDDLADDRRKQRGLKFGSALERQAQLAQLETNGGAAVTLPPQEELQQQPQRQQQHLDELL